MHLMVGEKRHKLQRDKQSNRTMIPKCTRAAVTAKTNSENLWAKAQRHMHAIMSWHATLFSLQHHTAAATAAAGAQQADAQQQLQPHHQQALPTLYLA
jgi:hypothetical protein